MTFANLHKLITYFVAGLGLYALTLGGQLGGAATFVVALAYGASFFFERPLIGRPSWLRGWNIAVLGVFLLQVARGATGEPILTLGVEFAAFLQISRLFNRRTAADHQQVAVLAVLHLIAATILSVDLGFAVAFVGFVVATPWMLALSQLRKEVEGTSDSSEAFDASHVDRVLKSRRLVGARFLAGTAALTVPIFALTLMLFLAFPRVGLGFLSFSSDVGQPTTGFGRNVELGGFGTLRTDATVVLRFWLEGEESVFRPHRFRGTSFDRYDGRAWSRTDLQSRPVPGLQGFYPLERGADQSGTPLRIELEAIDEPVVFLPERTVAIQIPERFDGPLRASHSLSLGAGLDLRYDPEETAGLRYTAIRGDSDQWLSEPEDTVDRRRYLQLPSPAQAARLDEVRAAAEAVTRGASTDRERADAIHHWLRESGEFRYSLTMPPTEDDDPLGVFVADARYGHCEYFSSAMAIMLRTQGIPARNVTGFVGGRFNRYGGYYAVVQGDAHSWVEAYLDGTWVTYDPTPAAGPDVPAAGGGMFGELQSILDAIRSRWLTNVVGYDLSQQISILEEVREFFDGWSGMGNGGGDSETQTEVDEGEGDVGALLWGALAFMVLTFFAALVAWRRRHGPRPVADAARLYLALDQALRRRGYPRAPHVAPLEHVESLRQRGFDEAAIVEQITVRYLEARFGRRSLSPEELRELRTKVREIARGAGSPRE